MNSRILKKKKKRKKSKMHTTVKKNNLVYLQFLDKYFFQNVDFQDQ